MLLERLYHYTHAFETRLFQLYELSLMKYKDSPFDGKFRQRAWKKPGETEDWINLARFIEPGEHVLLVDIGANVGSFTADFLSVYRNGRSICFEPVSSTYKRLSDRFAGNSRVEMHRSAISDMDGIIDINVHDNSTLSSIVQYTDEANRGYKTRDEASEKTDCHRLDSLNIQASDERLFVKIDVQGVEIEAIRGAMQTLSRSDAVLLECSFADEYASKEPSFAPACALLHKCGLYPIVFQNFGRGLSNYAFERDVLFVKRELLSRIWFTNYEGKNGRS